MIENLGKKRKKEENKEEQNIIIAMTEIFIGLLMNIYEQNNN